MKVKMIVASMLLALSLTACSPSPTDITDSVKQSLQETLNTDSDYAEYDLTVGDIELIKIGDNEYKALADIYLDGVKNTVPLDVYTEGNIFEFNAMWEAKPGAFLFVAEKEIDQALNEFNVEMDNIQNELQSSLYEIEQEVDQANYALNDIEVAYDAEADYTSNLTEAEVVEEDYDFVDDGY